MTGIMPEEISRGSRSPGLSHLLIRAKGSYLARASLPEGAAEVGAATFGLVRR